MSSLTNLIMSIGSSLGGIFTALAPSNIEPVIFYCTFAIISILVYLVSGQLPIIKATVPDEGGSKAIQSTPQKVAQFIFAVVFGYFAASSAFVTIIISKFFPNVGMVIGVMLGLMIVVTFVFGDRSGKKSLGFATNLIFYLMFFIMIWATWTFAYPEFVKLGLVSSGTLVDIGNWGITGEDIAILIVIIGLIALIYFVFRKQESPTKDESFFDFIKGKLK